ncbi:phage holin family protein [Enterococcus ureilyticus]|uniref:phage holin family protein n=1 Tax=Enterococcus ureilyticus TaxID=1131292 RepID=UPI001A9168EE|nr:phage holin family protein [Enterococcus ureilyticus]MBO0445546.1 phage holin family protein [Enterococcus ureilyticus]
MNDIFMMMKDQLFKMGNDNSWLIGTAGGLALTIPQWVFSDTWTLSHTVLLLLLLGVLILDWITGRKLADKSDVIKKKTEIVIDSLIRDGLIFLICLICYGVDYLIGTHSIVFTVFTVAFIYHNFSSFVANATILGWDKNYPLWLFNLILRWIGDEIEAKQEKYFLTKDGDNDGNQAPN